LKRQAISSTVPLATLLLGLVLGVILVQNSSIFGRPAGASTTETIISTVTDTFTRTSTETVTTDFSSTSTVSGQSGSAQVAVTGTAFSVADFAVGSSGAFDCVTTAPTTPYLSVANTGTSTVQITGITIAWAGADNSFPPAASCAVGSAGSATAAIYVELVGTPKLTVAPASGQSYSGTVALSNGAFILFTGTWQASSSSLSAQVAVTGTSLNAAGFGMGTSGAITCVTTSPVAPYITLANTGTEGTVATGLVIIWAGAANYFSLTQAASCDVGAAGSSSAIIYAEFVATPKVSTAPVAGQTYSGYVTLSNGAQVLFTGTWQ
jgi:hypothetical protein